MTKSKTLHIDGKEISIISINSNDFISLTDMAKSQMQEAAIINWQRKHRFGGSRIEKNGSKCKKGVTR